MTVRTALATVAATFGLLAGGPLPVQPPEAVAAPAVPARWWIQPGVLPPQAAVSGRAISTSREAGRTYCRLGGVTMEAGGGFIPDTRSIYAVQAGASGGCELVRVLEISPRQPAVAQELMAEINRHYPLLHTVLQQEPKFVPGLGVAIPPDLMTALRMSLEFSGQTGGQVVGGVDARPLESGWERQAGLLPVGPVGPVSAGPNRGGGEVCNLYVGPAAQMSHLADRPAIVVPMKSVALISTTQAVYVDEACRLQPLVTIPVAGAAVAADRPPGRFGLPPAVTSPPGGGATTASSAPALAASPETAVLVFNGLRLLAGSAAAALSGPAGWSLLAGGAMILTGTAAYDIWMNKQASGLSDQKIGQLQTAGQFAETAEEKRKRCYEEWETAERICRRNPGGGGIAGGYSSIEDCMRGLVSESCKGNKVDWGSRGPPPGWTP